MALKGKLCWRLKEERGSLWYRVSSAIFREEDHILRLEGGKGSVWWNNLINIHRGVGASVERWINDNFVLRQVTSFDFILVGSLVGGRGYEMKHLYLGKGGEAWKRHRRL